MNSQNISKFTMNKNSRNSVLSVSGLTKLGNTSNSSNCSDLNSLKTSSIETCRESSKNFSTTSRRNSGITCKLIKNDEQANKIKGALFTLLGMLCLTSVLLLHRVNFLYFPTMTNNVQDIAKGVILCAFAFFYLVSKLKTYNIVYQINKDNLKTTGLTVILFALTLQTFGLASSYLRLSTALSIINQAPIFITIMAYLFLREKIGGLDVVVLGLCLLGSIVISFGKGILESIFGSSATDSAAEVHSDLMIGFVFAGLNILFRSSSIILMKLLIGKVDLMLINFLSSVLMVGMCIASMTANHEVVAIPSSFLAYLSLFALGFLTYLQFYSVQKGFELCSMVYCQQFPYISIVFSFILSSIFIGEQHYLSDYIGAGIILGANLFRSLVVYNESLRNAEQKKKLLGDIEMIECDGKNYKENMERKLKTLK